MPHLVDGKVVRRGVLQRSAPNKVHISCPRVLRGRIEVTLRRRHSFYADVLADDLSDVVAGAHETAVLVQAKPCTELYRERSKILDIGFEIGDGKHDTLGNEFLSPHWKGKKQEEYRAQEKNRAQYSKVDCIVWADDGVSTRYETSPNECE